MNYHSPQLQAAGAASQLIQQSSKLVHKSDGTESFRVEPLICTLLEK